MIFLPSDTTPELEKILHRRDRQYNEYSVQKQILEDRLVEIGLEYAQNYRATENDLLALGI